MSTARQNERTRRSDSSCSSRYPISSLLEWASNDPSPRWLRVGLRHDGVAGGSPPVRSELKLVGAAPCAVSSSSRSRVPVTGGVHLALLWAAPLLKARCKLLSVSSMGYWAQFFLFLVLNFPSKLRKISNRSWKLLFTHCFLSTYLDVVVKDKIIDSFLTSIMQRSSWNKTNT
jgi:hypothetical protein